MLVRDGTRTFHDSPALSVRIRSLELSTSHHRLYICGDSELGRLRGSTAYINAGQPRVIMQIKEILLIKMRPKYLIIQVHENSAG